MGFFNLPRVRIFFSDSIETLLTLSLNGFRIDEMGSLQFSKFEVVGRGLFLNSQMKDSSQPHLCSFLYVRLSWLLCFIQSMSKRKEKNHCESTKDK